jgi:hypothetical protein
VRGFFYWVPARKSHDWAADSGTGRLPIPKPHPNQKKPPVNHPTSNSVIDRHFARSIAERYLHGTIFFHFSHENSIIINQHFRSLLGGTRP